MICAFHIESKPRSANKQPKPSYSRLIGDAARQQYTGPFLSGPLYSRIIWFHKYASSQGDVDNIAKRIHDALKGIIYADDRSITHTVSIRVEAITEVEIIPDTANPEHAAKLIESLADVAVRDVLYIELGAQTDARIHLGPIQ